MLPGFSFLRFNSENIVEKYNAGYADITNELKVKETSVIRIASITKMLLCTAVWKLIDDGKLSNIWDMRLSDMFPNIHNAYMNVTLADVANHRAGFDNKMYVKEPTVKQDELFDEVAELEYVTNLLNTSPTYTPKTTFNYTNIGYSIIANVIKKQTGKTFWKLIEEEIFKPLDITDGFMGFSKNNHPIKGYRIKNNILTEDDEIAFQKNIAGGRVYFEPGGGAWLSTNSLCKIGQAYINEHYVSHNELELDYAYGWTYKSDVISATGSMGGFYTCVVLDRQYTKGYILGCNSNGVVNKKIIELIS